MKITDVLVEKFIELRYWYAKHSDHPRFQLWRKCLTFIIVGISLWFIWKQFFSGYTTLIEIDLRFHPRFLLLSWVCVSSATILGAWEWSMLVSALDVDFDILKGMRVGVVSNLAKYIPGSIWSYVGKAYGATKLGIPKSVAGLSIVLEFGILYSTGFLMMLLLIPSSGCLNLSSGHQWITQTSVIFFVILICIKLPNFVRKIILRLGITEYRDFVLKGFDWDRFTVVFVAVLLTWGLLGIGFVLLIMSMMNFDWYWIPRVILAMTVALLLGQIAFFVPMGVGIREAIFIAMLQPVAHPSLIVVLALAFRVESLVGEVFAAFLGYISGKIVAQ